MKIADLMVEKRQYQFTPEARNTLRNIVTYTLEKAHSHSGNARLVRNIIEKAIRLQAVRLLDENSWTKEELMLLKAEDVIGAKGIL